MPLHSRCRRRLLDRPALGYLSRKDRLLLGDALELGCDTLLTLDRKLRRNGAHFERCTGMRILLPSEHWALLRPWAALIM